MDRFRYHGEGNKIIESNWNSIGGYIADSTVCEDESEYEEEDENKDEVKSDDEIRERASVDPFVILKTEIEQIIGLPQGADAVQTIQEMIKIGVDPADIQAAADWYRSQNKTIHSARALLGPVKTALMKRKQQDRAPTKKDVDITNRFMNSEYAGFYKTG